MYKPTAKTGEIFCVAVPTKYNPLLDKKVIDKEQREKQKEEQK